MDLAYKVIMLNYVTVALDNRQKSEQVRRGAFRDGTISPLLLLLF